MGHEARKADHSETVFRQALSLEGLRDPDSDRVARRGPAKVIVVTQIPTVRLSDAKLLKIHRPATCRSSGRACLVA